MFLLTGYNNIKENWVVQRATCGHWTCVAHYAKLSRAMRAPWVDHFLNNEIYCYPLSKKRCRPPLRSPLAKRSKGIVTSGRQQRNAPWNGNCHHIDGLVQDCSMSSVLSMEILQSYTKPLMYEAQNKWTCKEKSLVNFKLPFQVTTVETGNLVALRQYGPVTMIVPSGFWPPGSLHTLGADRHI